MDYTRFERARIIGARALQIAMGAPPLLVEGEALGDSLAIAVREFQASTIPLTVQRSFHDLH